MDQRLFFYMYFQWFQHHCWKEGPFSTELHLHIYQKSVVHICVVYFWTLHYVPLIYWSFDLAWHQYHAVMIIVASKILKSGNVNPPNFIFFFKILLAISGPWHFHMNFKMRLSITTNILSGTLIFCWIYRSVWGKLTF